LIKGNPCPKCDGFWFLVPYCKKCGWKDEEWFREQEEIASDMMRLFLESLERYHNDDNENNIKER